jgi:hypothetical protein
MKMDSKKEATQCCLDAVVAIDSERDAHYNKSESFIEENSRTDKDLELKILLKQHSAAGDFPYLSVDVMKQIFITQKWGAYSEEL